MDEQLLADVLDRAVAVADHLDIPYAVIGGVAGAVHGRPVRTKDVDVFVRPPDAKRLLDALATEGFETEEVNDTWLYKAHVDGVTVDVIFRSSAGLYLDDAMLARVVEGEFGGRKVRAISSTDLLLMLGLAASAEVSDYWFDAAELINHTDIDWEYLLERASWGPKRLLALMAFADSNGLSVPERVIRELSAQAYGR
jgi:predicted nucleotidyltransferase